MKLTRLVVALVVSVTVSFSSVKSLTQTAVRLTTAFCPNPASTVHSIIDPARTTIVPQSRSSQLSGESVTRIVCGMRRWKLAPLSVMLNDRPAGHKYVEGYTV